MAGKKRPVIHAKHVSRNPDSVFYRKSPGVGFIPGFEPIDREHIVEKSKANAFAETPLADHLRRHKIDSMVLVGFTAGECIDATARGAKELGYHPLVVGDATASFDLRGVDGRVFRAVKAHRLILANLHAFFARVLDTQELLRSPGNL